MQTFNRKLKRALIAALKIGAGSALAIFIATLFGLTSPASAGTITLLTLLAQTRRGTLSLIRQRLLSFALTVGVCWIIFLFHKSVYLSFAIFLIIVVFILEMLGWQSTLSVNSLIGLHFLIEPAMTMPFLLNEFFLLLIGMLVALLLNLVQPVVSERHMLYRDMRHIEKELQEALGNVSVYMKIKDTHTGTWKNIASIERELAQCVQNASVYANNSFNPNAAWFMGYFEFRLHQCMIVHRLHQHCRAIRSKPENANMISNFIASLVEFVPNTCVPAMQMEALDALINQTADVNRDISRENFEDRAMLYHLLLDLHEYLEMKQQFIESLNEDQQREYDYKNITYKERIRQLERAALHLDGGHRGS